MRDEQRPKTRVEFEQEHRMRIDFDGTVTGGPAARYPAASEPADWLSGAGSGTSDGNPLLGLGSSMNVISSTSRISIIGVTLITAAVLPEPICIATQIWTMPMNEKFRPTERVDREGAVLRHNPDG